jgi:hypothetical protein
MITIKQSIVVETTTSQLTQKDISFDTLEDGHVGSSSIMLYTGKIDKDLFNKASQENVDYPRLFDRDCYYQVWVNLANGKLRVFKISGYPVMNTHTPDYLKDKPYRNPNTKNVMERKFWESTKAIRAWEKHQKKWDKSKAEEWLEKKRISRLYG